MDKVQHFEIPAEDMERAEKFYSDVLGWVVQKIEMPGGTYHFAITSKVDEKGRAKEPGAINGGLVPKKETATHPMIVITVDSIEASIKKAEDAGGKVVMPSYQVGDMGMYAHIEDTEGNVIGFWENLKK